MGGTLKMRFKAHQSFFIRKGWLGKGLRTVENDPTILMPSNSKAAMDELGLGANQVVALRYWLEVAGLIRKQIKDHAIEELGYIILDNDPYFEEVGTLWAIHCNIASAQEKAASWYFFFNEFKVSAFSKEDFSHALERYVHINNAKSKVALTSFEADFSCILNTYMPHDKTNGKPVSPESVIDCPLGELGLIDEESTSDKTYRKRPANPGVLPSLLVLYAICSARENQENPESEVKLETLLDDPCMPGRLYNLDSVALLTKLYELESDGYLRINRTAGLDVIRLTFPDMGKEECLAKYYELIG